MPLKREYKCVREAVNIVASKCVMTLFGPLWGSPLGENLRRTRAAYVAGERRLDAMDMEWGAAGGVCCPGCMFGAAWSRLVGKQSRRLHWIEVLEVKLARASQH